MSIKQSKLNLMEEVKEYYSDRGEEEEDEGAEEMIAIAREESNSSSK